MKLTDRLTPTACLPTDHHHAVLIGRIWSHDVHGQLSGGKFSHPSLPMPLDHLEAAVHCYDGNVRLGIGGQLIAFANLTPLTNTGTAANVVFNLPNTATVNALLRDTMPGDGFVETL